MRRGFNIEQAVMSVPMQDSIKDFYESSLWEDWIGLSIDEVYNIYWKWCIENGYSPKAKQCFSRQLISALPMLKVVPTKKEDKYYRIIRLTEDYL